VGVQLYPEAHWDMMLVGSSVLKSSAEDSCAVPPVKLETDGVLKTSRLLYSTNLRAYSSHCTFPRNERTEKDE
jgi:hypothetical protein